MLMKTIAGQMEPSAALRVRRLIAGCRGGSTQACIDTQARSLMVPGATTPSHAARVPCPTAQQMGGEVRYNGQLPSEFDLQRTAAYVDQVS